jgi:transcription elongation factor GreA
MRAPYRKPTKFTFIKPDPLITEEKLKELENKLAHLKKIRPQLAAEVSRCAQFGDFSENVEYQIAKGKLRGVNQKIIDLENHLKQAVVIPLQHQTTMIQLGHTVTIEAEGKQKIYQILGSSEIDLAKGIISYSSPIGMALMGKGVGEVAKVKLANGKEVEYKVVKIE